MWVCVRDLLGIECGKVQARIALLASANRDV
jgi:hypothetical protein